MITTDNPTGQPPGMLNLWNRLETYSGRDVASVRKEATAKSAAAKTAAVKPSRGVKQLVMVKKSTKQYAMSTVQGQAEKRTSVIVQWTDLVGIPEASRNSQRPHWAIKTRCWSKKI